MTETIPLPHPGMRARSLAQASPSSQSRLGKRAKLDLEKRSRDLAMFNLASDSKLRGCDLVALRVADVAPNGYAMDSANVRQRKIVTPVRFELRADTAGDRRLTSPD
jgi:hypothetical protein